MGIHLKMVRFTLAVNTFLLLISVGEYVDSRDNNKYIAQFVVYPHQQIQKGLDGKTQREESYP